MQIFCGWKVSAIEKQPVLTFLCKNRSWWSWGWQKGYPDQSQGGKCACTSGTIKQTSADWRFQICSPGPSMSCSEWCCSQQCWCLTRFSEKKKTAQSTTTSHILLNKWIWKRQNLWCSRKSLIWTNTFSLQFIILAEHRHFEWGNMKTINTRLQQCIVYLCSSSHLSYCHKNKAYL